MRPVFMRLALARQTAHLRGSGAGYPIRPELYV